MWEICRVGRAGGLRKQQAEKNEEEDARSSESAIAEVLFSTRVWRALSFFLLWCNRRVFFSVERKIPSSRWRRSPCKQPGYLHQPPCASPGSWPAPVLPSLPGTLGSELLLLLPSEVWISKPKKANGCRDWILLLTSMAGKLQDTTNISSSSGFSGTW